MTNEKRPTPTSNLDHDQVNRGDFEDALKDVLLSEAPDRPRSENREPTREELNQRWKLSRRD